MIRVSLALLLVCCATLGHAADAPAPRPCTDADPTPTKLAHDEHGGALKVDKCWRYADRTGDYQLYLLASADRQDGDVTLSRSLAAQLFRKRADGTLVSRWVLHDRIEEGEAGAWFSKKLTEFADLDGDGTVTPILVIRFVPLERDEPDAPVDYGAYAGRIKFILFRSGTKVAIRAVTGELDDERHTTATASFFQLPARTQRHLVHKIANLHQDEGFAFDDRWHFYPRREKSR